MKCQKKYPRLSGFRQGYTYKPLYLEAYSKNSAEDEDAMADIEEALEYTDLGYDSDDFTKWIQAYEDQLDE